MNPSRDAVLSSARAIVLAAALASLGACAGPSDKLGDTVSTSQGDVLVAANGDTLYTYDKDTPGHSACTGGCAAVWPPAEAGPKAQAHGDFSIITRPDATRQWAYKDKPLYTYRLDGGPGSISGDDTDGVWHVAKP
jgi:predicted lipoprotein with Yx(FWY)xxD motif